ncbi:MAG: glycosyltransferase [Pseudomonadota bacterium]
MPRRKPLLFLDVSRLFSRYALARTPTGIDRVELQWANWALSQDDFDVRPVVQGPVWMVGLMGSALKILARGVEASWREELPASRARRMAPVLKMLTISWPVEPPRRPAVALNLGHYGLDKPWAFAAFGAPLVVLVHDLLPLSHPAFEPPGAPAAHAARMATVGARAAHVFSVSNATADAIRAHLGPACPPITITPNGPCLPTPRTPAATRRPFVFLSTLNKRKNAGLLMRVWETFQALEDPPQLIIIGRAGDDGETVATLASRRLRGVTWHGASRDPEVAALLAGAAALVTPSFAEGFNVPIAEAHALGVPVVASDLPVHREVAGAGAVYLPHNIKAWRDALLTLHTDPTARERLQRAITPPATWDDHFAAAVPVLERLVDHSHSMVPGGFEVTS